jgi:DNA modification methylase
MGQARHKDDRAFWTLHRHDARELEELFAKRADDGTLITTTITSPPYGALKDYGHPEQIGFGQDYNAYLQDMEHVFAQIHERTTEDGSLWLIADTYMSNGPAPTRLLPVPFDLAHAAESAGFTLRDVIIWQKDRTLPWSNGTRLRNAFEYVLLLAKGANPKYRLDRLRDHSDVKQWWTRFPERYNPRGKAPSNVWNIPIPKQGSWGDGEIAHACPLPPELVERLLLLSSDEGDVVMDPFAGSGVVVAEAERLGRLGVGTELVPRHVDEFQRIIRPEILGRAEHSSSNGHDSEATAQLLVHLRMLKLPVVLMRGAARRRAEFAWPLGAVVLPGKQPPGAGRHASIRLIFVVGTSNKAQRDSYARTIQELLARPPSSKFGLDCEVEVIPRKALKRAVAGRKIFLYPNGRTSRSTGSVQHKALPDLLADHRDDSIPPIFSTVFVDVPPRPEAALLNGDGQLTTDEDQAPNNGLKAPLASISLGSDSEPNSDSK